MLKVSSGTTRPSVDASTARGWLDAVGSRGGTISSMVGHLPPSDVDAPTPAGGAIVVMGTDPARTRVLRKNT